MTDYESITTEELHAEAERLAETYGPIHDVEGYTSGAEYANVVAPKLRKAAGVEDDGHGTYKVDRLVLIDGEQVLASDLIEEVVDHFFEAAAAEEEG